MQLLLFKCMYYTYIETIQNSWANVTTGFEILSQVYLIVFKWQHKVLSDSGYVEHMNHLVNILSSLFKTRISDVLPVNQYISEKTHIHTVTLTLLKTGFFFFIYMFQTFYNQSMASKFWWFIHGKFFMKSTSADNDDKSKID